jgi:hypothetical protein
MDLKKHSLVPRRRTDCEVTDIRSQARNLIAGEFAAGYAKQRIEKMPTRYVLELQSIDIDIVTTAPNAGQECSYPGISRFWVRCQ